MKIEIKHRWNASILFAANIPDETAPQFRIRAALRMAVKSGSDLRGSDLRGSDLSGSNLSGSNLSESNLRGSDLRGSNLSGSDLSGSNLSESNLTPIRDDLWAVLSAVPNEADGLLAALIAGRIDGSTYEGKCACLVGTIASLRKENYQKLDGLKPNSSRPIERFFLSINLGDTPTTNQFSKIAAEWIGEWLVNMRSAFGVKISTTSEL